MITFEQIDYQSIDRVTALHKLSLHGFLSELGEPFLKELYKTLISMEPELQIAAFNDGEFVGFVSGTINSRTILKRALVKNPFGLLSGLVLGIIHNPRLVTTIFKVIFYPGFSKFEGISAELLSITVNDKSRGKGVGKALVSEISHKFKEAGVWVFKVSIWEDLSSNEFYRKSGFEFLGKEKFLNGEMNFYKFDC